MSLSRRYGELKHQAKDALLLFRLGDFYALFFEDAIVASGELGIELRNRAGPSASFLAIPRISIFGAFWTMAIASRFAIKAGSVAAPTERRQRRQQVSRSANGSAQKVVATR
jgi:hypothetical protein